MADISKCANVSCPIRKKCYRFTAKPSYYQSFTNYKYNSGCLDFLDNKNRKDKWHPKNWIMLDSTKILNVLNMCRMELHNEKQKKMDKTINYSKVILLEKIINQLQ